MHEGSQMSFSMTMVCVCIYIYMYVSQAPAVYSNYANVTLAHMKLTCPVQSHVSFIAVRDGE